MYCVQFAPEDSADSIGTFVQVLFIPSKLYIFSSSANFGESNFIVYSQTHIKKKKN